MKTWERWQLQVSAAVLVWMNALPYLSRLPRGLDWVAQYWPDPGFEVVGLIFFHAFYSLPAIPLINSLREDGRPGFVWALALVLASTVSWLFHMDYDLAADAQAATGLVILPAMIAGLAWVVLAAGRWVWHR